MPKTILITGASAGIGRAVAERLASDGYRVITIARHAPEAPIEGEHFVEADLSGQDAGRELFVNLAHEHEIVGLVNNVAALRAGPLQDATLEDLDAAVRMKLGVALVATQAVVGGMKQRRYGRIVNISSISALGMKGRSVYSASNAGMNGLTRTWALELASYGITVNSIAPGPIATELFRTHHPDDSPKTKSMIEHIPVKRMGQPADVAHMVSSLIDPRSGFVTGQVIYVCGGTSIGAR